MKIFTQALLSLMILVSPTLEAQAVEANFTFTTSGSVATFENTSLAATSFIWSFGDGTTSTDINPIHNYSTTDSTYRIDLIASDAGVSDTMTVFLSFTCMSYVLDLDYFQDSILCSGESEILVAPIGFYSYHWYKNGISLHESHDNFTMIDSAGQYMCIMTTASGCGAISNPISYYSAPDSTTNIVSTSSDLELGSEVTLSLGYTPTSLVWSTGDATSEIIVSKDGNYSVDFINLYGCEEIKIKNIEYDSTSFPSLVFFENSLKLENIDLLKVNQIIWTKDDITLDSATLIQLLVSENGLYKADIHYANGNTFGLQMDVYLNMLGISAIDDVVLSSSLVFINHKAIQVPDRSGSLKIFDLNGKFLYQNDYSEKQEFDLSYNLPLIIYASGANGSTITTKIF